MADENAGAGKRKTQKKTKKKQQKEDDTGGNTADVMDNVESNKVSDDKATASPAYPPEDDTGKHSPNKRKPSDSVTDKHPSVDDLGHASVDDLEQHAKDPETDLPVSRKSTARKVTLPDERLISSEFGDIAGIITDDDLAIRRLRKKNELPLNRYSSLSVILNPPMSREEMSLEDQLMVVRKIDVDPMTMTTLQPLYQSTPYYISLSKLKKMRESQLLAAEKDAEGVHRVAPAGFICVLDEPASSGQLDGLSVTPVIPPTMQDKMTAQHPGIAWPATFANMPPYTSPGYNCPGIKQPVGVVPFERVPWKSSLGVVGTQKIKVPTWVSPLYKPYGIGGSFGPYGPFYTQDAPEKEAMKKSQCGKQNRVRDLIQWVKSKFKKRTGKSKEKSTQETQQSQDLAAQKEVPLTTGDQTKPTDGKDDIKPEIQPASASQPDVVGVNKSKTALETANLTSDVNKLEDARVVNEESTSKMRNTKPDENVE